MLADNPLGDPHVRTLDVWLPPQYDQLRGRGRGKRFPVVYDLVGFTGSGRSHTNWRAFDENVPERAARLVHERKMGPAHRRLSRLLHVARRQPVHQLDGDRRATPTT